MKEAPQRWTLSFADPELERAYQADSASSTLLAQRVLTGIIVLVVSSLTLTDALTTSRANAEANFWYRTCGMLPVALTMLSLSFVPRWYGPLRNVVNSAGMFAVLWITLFMAMNVPDIATFDPAGHMSFGISICAMGVFIGVLRLPSVLTVIGFPPLAALSGAGAYVVFGAAGLAYSLWYGIATLISCAAAILSEQLFRRAFVAQSLLAAERRRSDALLKNVLPEVIAERLKSTPGRVAERFDEVSVLFADIVGFTPLARSLKPEELVVALDEVFSEFDELARLHGLEKIKTIGDAYMVVGGAPTRMANHAEAIARMALDLQKAVARRGQIGGQALSLRIGIHSGPVVAGVIGKNKFIYDLWGDTVNTASRMESHGAPGEVHLTDATRARLGPSFAVESRGAIELKGIGSMTTYFLRSGAAASVPGAA